ncbi:MAG: hypothetical protein FWC34_00395, partial [Bacteroidetes bacterium]|nr:hypothetical protein [Bacteroidota bacterium]MCL2303705.1 hypothetical protein [Lentimicrobiaceae bacterium]
MKKILFAFLAITLIGASSIHAQNTDGTDFWLTFGKNWRDGSESYVIPRIHVVSKDLHTTGTIVFTNLPDGNPHKIIPLDIPPQTVRKIELNDIQRAAAYLTAQGTSSLTIKITTDHPVTAYALNQCIKSADATNLLPVTALGTDYYQISYQPQGSDVGWPTQTNKDAYAVIATENGTNVYHNGTLVTLIPLNIGQVYHRTSDSDMTGAHITTNKPVAFFALNQGTYIKYNSSRDNLFQQLAPINTWGKNFLIPVADIYPSGSTPNVNRVRIVASQPTTVTRTGGIHISQGFGEYGGSSPGIGNGPVYNLIAGQFIELEVNYNNNGCFIEANNPVGVCAYLITPSSTSHPSDPSQAWLPSMEQTAKNALIAPFNPPPGTTALTTHKALIISPTETKNDTKVAIGTGALENLSGGEWRDNVASNMSFYNYPMTNVNESYRFSNSEGIIVMGYGYGSAESYYYLGYSSMRNLDAYFEVNGIHYQDLQEELICTNDIDFVAVLENVNNIKWYINDTHQPSWDDETEWSQSFPAGEYTIKIWVLFEDGTIKDDIIGIVNIGAQIIVTATEGGMVSLTDTCIKVGDPITLTATTTDPSYIFDYWSENDVPITPPPGTTYTFTVTDDRDLKAHFRLNTVEIQVSATEGGSASGGGTFNIGETITVTAEETNPCYYFVSWTDKEIGQVSTDLEYEFEVTGAQILQADFTKYQYNITTSVATSGTGTITGNGTGTHEHDCGNVVTLTPVPATGYHFEKWVNTETGLDIFDNPLVITVNKDSTFVAHFAINTYDITVSVNPSGYGTACCAIYDIEHFDTHTVVATPADSCTFVNWTKGGVPILGAGPSYTFDVTETVELVANFKLKEYSVTLLKYPDNPDVGNVSGANPAVVHGTTIPIFASPSFYYTFLHWEDETNTVISTDPIHTITVRGDRTLTAVFLPKTYTITATPSPEEGGSATVIGGGEDIAYGLEKTALAIPNPFWQFSHWAQNSNAIPGTYGEPSYTFTVHGDRNLVAVFEEETYNIKVLADPDFGAGMVYGDDYNVHLDSTKCVLAA